ncbi:MAG TPA: glycosyltransferase [Acidimicrobiales bacterium]|nr:glycosyltransferase [Acidimicrobiales bacterium]
MRVLCTCLPGHGHFLPMRPFATALAAAGHEVAFATAGEFCPHVDRAGFPAFPAGLSLPRQLEEANRRYPEAELPPGKERFEAFVPRMLAGVAAPARAADLVPIVADWRPDVVVHDETELAGPVAAAVAGIPWADHSMGILRPLQMLRLAGNTLAPTAREWGVDVGPCAGLFRYLYLDVCPPRLQSPEVSDVAVAHAMRNLAGAGAGGELPGWIASLPAQPTVYVSLGTLFNRDATVFAAVLEGLRDEPLNLILTVGHDNDPEAFGPQPANVHVERFIPQALLLPHCDAVVNQGGTALLDILGHGLPVLVLPQGANQFHNAEACVHAGVGRRLLPDEVSADAVRADVRLLLDDASYRQAAETVAAELAAMPGPEEGVSLVERLHREQRPLHSAGAGAGSASGTHTGG